MRSRPPWRDGNGRSATCAVEGEPDFPQVGINLNVLAPGEGMSVYHWEADQEDFLVLAGTARGCPPGTARAGCPARTY
jgi:uncharacterized cupin superfamily protein